MIKYRAKKGKEGMTYMGKFYKVLGDCTQSELKQIYNEGNTFVEQYELQKTDTSK